MDQQDYNKFCHRGTVFKKGYLPSEEIQGQGKEGGGQRKSKGDQEIRLLGEGGGVGNAFRRELLSLYSLNMLDTNRFSVCRTCISLHRIYKGNAEVFCRCVCVCVFMYLVISESEATECKFKSKIFFPSGSLRPKLFWVLLMYTVW